MKHALAGVKVVGFTSAAAGPLTERCLADFGATVVHVESSKNVDIVRTIGPYKDGIPGVNRGAYFNSYNPNKYSLALDMKHPKVGNVVQKLIPWADVVVDNWVAGTLAKWGLSDEAMVKMKPDLVICHTSNQGQTGPHSKRRGLGLHLEGLAGFQNLAGWPDSTPQALGAFTDYSGGIVSANAIMAALLHRQYTGQGQVIDVSQYEVGVNLLGPCFLDYFVNGNTWQRMGNRSPHAAPHGAFRCRGDDRWCDITIFTDAEWESFCKMAGYVPWTRDSRFATVLGRKSNEDELEKLVEAWSMDYPPEQLMVWLQAAGIAAGVVEDIRDLFSDPQVKQRGFLKRAEHPVMGPFVHITTAISMSKTPTSLRLPTPCLGEHSLYVCKELLGMPDAEIDEMVMADVFV